MRAIYLEKDFSKASEIIITDNSYHHLAKVLRVKINESLLALNGEGINAELEIIEINKKQIKARVSNIKFYTQTNELSFFVGKLKKEAMDLVIKQSCEIGIKELIIGDTDYSQRYDLRPDRLRSLVISSIEQSNNPFLLKVRERSIKEIDLTEYEQILCFSLTKNNENKVFDSQKKSLIIIGPEGGLSVEEEDYLANSHDNVSYIKLPTYILRAPTALGCAAGYFFSK